MTPEAVDSLRGKVDTPEGKVDMLGAIPQVGQATADHTRTFCCRLAECRRTTHPLDATSRPEKAKEGARAHAFGVMITA